MERAAEQRSRHPATRSDRHGGLERLADVPIYRDRFAGAPRHLAATARCAAAGRGLPPALWQQLGLLAGSQVRIVQGGAAPC